MGSNFKVHLLSRGSSITGFVLIVRWYCALIIWVTTILSLAYVAVEALASDSWWLSGKGSLNLEVCVAHHYIVPTSAKVVFTICRGLIRYLAYHAEFIFPTMLLVRWTCCTHFAFRSLGFSFSWLKVPAYAVSHLGVGYCNGPFIVRATQRSIHFGLGRLRFKQNRLLICSACSGRGGQVRLWGLCHSFSRPVHTCNQPSTSLHFTA